MAAPTSTAATPSLREAVEAVWVRGEPYVFRLRDHDVSFDLKGLMETVAKRQYDPSLPVPANSPARCDAREFMPNDGPVVRDRRAPAA